MKKRSKQSKKNRVKPKSKALVPLKKKNYYNAVAGAAGKLIGNIVDRSFGGAPSRITNGLGNIISGRGTYSVRSNVLMGQGFVPRFVTSRDGIRICHREYLADIQSSSAFVNEQYVLNPGLNSTFPWLSNLASKFEQNKIMGLVFYYRSL